MTGNTQHSPFDTDADAAKAHEYEQAVLAYEKLDSEVDALLTAHGGHSENMTPAEFAHYRELAERRDLAYNTMKLLERQLLDE
jgi:hypothetical protein